MWPHIDLVISFISSPLLTSTSFCVSASQTNLLSCIPSFTRVMSSSTYVNFVWTYFLVVPFTIIITVPPLNISNHLRLLPCVYHDRILWWIHSWSILVSPKQKLVIFSINHSHCSLCWRGSADSERPDDTVAFIREFVQFCDILLTQTRKQQPVTFSFVLYAANLRCCDRKRLKPHECFCRGSSFKGLAFGLVH